MSAAVAEREQPGADALPTVTGAPGKARVFVSRRKDLRLVLEPEVDQFTPSGNKRAPLPGFSVQFIEHRLVVPMEAQGKDAEAMTVGEKGNKMTSAELLTRLEEHPMYGNTVEGFWPLAPIAPLPTAADIAGITKLAIALDVDALAQLILVEEEGWAREALLTPAHEALEQVEAAKTELAEQRDAALKQARAEGAAEARAGSTAKG